MTDENLHRDMYSLMKDYYQSAVAKRNKQYAISLFELLIVICIISIVGLLAMPMLHHYFGDAAELVLQKQIISALEFTQQTARTTHKNIAICLSQDLNECSTAQTVNLISFVDQYNDGKLHQSQQLLMMQQNKAGGNLHWRAFPQTRNYLRFTKSGADNGTFWYCAEQAKTASWAIAINKLGRVRKVDEAQLAELGC